MAATYGVLPTGWSQAELDTFFGNLAVQADQAWQAFFRQRVPSELTPQMNNYLAAVSPPSTGFGSAVIANGASIVVHSLADTNVAGSPGTATVVNGVLTKVNLTV